MPKGATEEPSLETHPTDEGKDQSLKPKNASFAQRVEGCWRLEARTDTHFEIIRKKISQGKRINTVLSLNDFRFLENFRGVEHKANY